MAPIFQKKRPEVKNDLHGCYYSTMKKFYVTYSEYPFSHPSINGLMDSVLTFHTVDPNSIPGRCTAVVLSKISLFNLRI